MKEIIRNQISSEIFKQIAVLEKERNQEKQKIIAQEIIHELNIEDFTPYMAYDDESNIFIAMNYYYSAYGIEESLLCKKHDVVFTFNDIYIEDENLLKEYRHDITIANEDEKQEIIKIYKNQKKYDEISEKLKFLNNQLMNLVNFERPKCIGIYEKITQIDKEINSLENLISELEQNVKEIENES